MNGFFVAIAVIAGSTAYGLTLSMGGVLLQARQDDFIRILDHGEESLCDAYRIWSKDTGEIVAGMDSICKGVPK